jgi:hypothetical protein
MTQDEIVPPTTLRDTLETNFEAAEAGVLPSAEDVRARDDAGRFVRKEEQRQEAQANTAPAANTAAPPQATEPAPLQRPTTWKKDYLPIWDKIAAGQPLTPEEGRKLAEYSNQRENEYKTGVSTYRSEAQQARELQEAVAPFLNDLQMRGKTPSQWIKEVGDVHNVLQRGSPEQKLQLLTALAQNYGIPLSAAAPQHGGMAPLVAQLMAPIGDLRNQVQTLAGKLTQREQNEQQREMASMNEEISRMAADTKNYPHFEAVREDMAQLLETGVARDLPTAYVKAVRLNDQVYDLEVNRLVADRSPKPDVAANARARALSPKSATPSGQVATQGSPKDRRAQLAENFDAAGGGRV